jgi:archaellum biogenesis protein FlaJ (TadC family)
MTIPAINYIAVLLAAISSMIVGAVWYAKPVFGNTWMRLSGITEEDTKKNPVLPLVITFLVSIVTALVLAGAATLAHDFYEGNFLLDAILTGLILWAGFTAARLLTHDLFDRRPAKLTLLNMAHELVTILVMALIIGVWPPA